MKMSVKNSIRRVLNHRRTGHVLSGRGALLSVAVLALAAGAAVGASAAFAEPATATKAAPDTAAKPAAASGATLKVDGSHSGVVYRISHLGVSNFWGTFDKVDGTFSFDPANPQSGSFNITIDAESIDSNNAQRDGHLKSPDFFNTKQFPTITFKSTGIKKAGENFELTGDLTLLGKSKPITAKLQYLGEGDKGERFGYRAGVEATFTFKRSDFGMKYGIEGNVLGDDVMVIVSLEGIK